MAIRGWGVGVEKARERAPYLALVACRVPGFGSQHPRGGLQPCVTPVAGDLMASLTSTGIWPVRGARVSGNTTHIRKIKVNRYIAKLK